MSNKTNWLTIHQDDLLTDSDDDCTTANAKVAERDRRTEALRIKIEQFKEEKRKKKQEERVRQKLLDDEKIATAEKRSTIYEEVLAEERRHVQQEAAAATQGQGQGSAPADVTAPAGTCVCGTKQPHPQGCQATPGTRKVMAYVPCQVARKKCDSKQGSGVVGPSTAGQKRRRAHADSPTATKRARTDGMTGVSGASALDEDELLDATEGGVGMLTDAVLLLVKKCDEWAELQRESIDAQREELEETKKLRLTQERLVVLLVAAGEGRGSNIIDRERMLK